MKIQINKRSVTPLYKQIENSIKALIMKEELTNGYKLPSERKLAAELGVHRNTIIRAYSNLVAEGVIVSSRTSPRGYFVLRSESAKGGSIFFPLAKMIKYNFSTKEKTFAQIFDNSNSDEFISLGGIVMDDEINPANRIGSILDKMKNGSWSKRINRLQNNEIDRLKNNVCELLKTRNMYINKKNVQIVSETTEALSHIIDLYLKEGDCVIVEEPVIPDTVNLFRNKGVEAVCVSLETDGPNLKELELLIVNKKPKFLYVMPNFHNPTAVVMSLCKRIQLLEISHKYGIPIIEEDSLRDFNYTAKDYPTLYSLDQYKSVLYIDTFTLTFLPGIKTAFIVGPYEPIDIIGQYIIMSQVVLSNIGQYMLNEFIESGEYENYLVDMRTYYNGKKERLVQCLNKMKYKGLRFAVPEGGLYIWCCLGSQINEKELFFTCRELGLLIMPGYIFYPNGYQGEGHIRLCYSNIPEDKIEEAVAILDKAIDLNMNGN